MHVVLTNFGTTGDVQPFLALALELRRHGHRPVLGLSPSLESRVSSYELEFVPVGPDLLAFQQEVIKAQLAPSNSLTQLISLFAPLVAALPQMFEDLRAACRGADALVCGPVQPAGRMVHELTGIPFLSVQVSHFSGGGAPAFQQASAALINRFREQVKLPPLRDPVTIDANSPQVAVYALSRHVYPRSPDWPDHYHMPGYFFLDDRAWRPDPALAEFVEAGPPPVVVTFGSECYEDNDAMTELVLKAVKLTGHRTVIQQGWSNLGASVTPPADVFVTGYAPHDWLFPRAACVVHHGGAGTAAAAFRAGVPSVFVTHAGGQPLRAQLAHELGCAGPAVPYARLSAEGLAAAIRHVLDTPAYHLASAELGRKVREERGVEDTRLLLEQLVAAA